jgi:SpoVK/Ycf46/Vps4 family AAA+-type ATPase
MYLNKVAVKSTKQGLEFSKTKAFIAELAGKILEMNTEFTIEFDYFILYSEPFRKGIINKSTEIVCVLEDFLIDELYGIGIGGLVEIALDESVTGIDCYCSWDTLTFMGIFDKDYILLDNRLIRVNGREHGRRGVLHLSRQEYINQSNSEIFEWQPTNLTYESTPAATQVTISAIQTPTLTKNIYNQTLIHLKSYLLEKRIYKQNDLITFPISKSKSEFIDLLQLNTTELLDTLDFNDPIWVFFRIDKVSGNFKSEFKITETTKVVESAKTEPGLIKTKETTKSCDSEIDGKATDPKTTKSCTSEIYELVKTTIHPKYDMFTSIILSGGPGSGKKTILNQIAKTLNIQIMQFNLYTLLKDTMSKTRQEFIKVCEHAVKCTPCLLVLDHLEALQESWSGNPNDSISFFKDGIDILKNIKGFPVILCGLTNDLDKINEKLVRSFGYIFKTKVFWINKVPDEQERFEILSALLGDVSLVVDKRLFSRQSAGFSISDLKSCAMFAYYEALKRSLGFSVDVGVLKDAGVLILEEDLEKAIAKTRGNVADKIGAPKIPNVQWEDIGGLGHVKDTILETIELPLKHPEMFKEGVKKRSGVLLYGPPGTGYYNLYR